MVSAKELLVSVVIPVHNEVGNLEWQHERITSFFKGKKLSREVIYVDDGSTDDSLELIKKISRKDPTVKFVSFSRNFGKEAATTAGLKKASGDIAIIMDADGQHPVELIDKFIGKWREGYHVVIGVRKANTKEGVLKRYGSKLFYRLLSSFTGGKSITGSTDFRLIDRLVLDEFNKLTEHNRITRGLIDWLGFKRAYVSFVAPARHSGKASYGIRKLIRLAIHAFISQTTKPLQFTGLMGFMVMVLSAFTGVFLFFEKYVFKDPLNLAVTGTALLALFLSFLIGLVLICQWLLALYIESIHSETQNRPLFIVEEKSE